MKYPKLTAFLGLATLNLHSGLFGTKNHYRLDEEQVQKLEDQLAAQGSEDVQKQLDDLQKNYDTLQSNYNTLETANTGLQNAVTQALELNELTDQLTDKQSVSEGVVLLGTKCKEYGTSNNRHSFQKNDGQEKNEDGLVNGVVNMNDAHNQID